MMIFSNWYNLYTDAQFGVPEDALPPKGKPVWVTIWVEPGHA